MSPERPPWRPGGAAVFLPSPAGLHGLDGDQGNTAYKEKGLFSASVKATLDPRAPDGIERRLGEAATSRQQPGRHMFVQSVINQRQRR